MGTIHVPTLLEGILEATAAKAQAEARITTLRAALEDEGRRRLKADGAAPSWNAPRLGKVRLDPASDWTASVATEDAFASYVAEHYPSEVTANVALKAEDLADALQALEFIGVTPVDTRLEVRSAWRDKYLEALAVDVEEEEREDGSIERTITVADTISGEVVPGTTATRKPPKLVVSLDTDRRTAAIKEAAASALALVESASDEDGDQAARTALADLDVRRRELEGMHSDTLVAIAKAHELPSSGTKPALAERIARAEAATGRVITTAATVPTPAPDVLPEGTEVEEVTTLPAHAPEPPIVDQPVEEVPDGGDVAEVDDRVLPDPDGSNGIAPDVAAYTNSLDQPAEADLVEALGPRELLRKYARRLGVSAGGSKRDVAEALVAAGHTATTLKELPA